MVAGKREYVIYRICGSIMLIFACCWIGYGKVHRRKNEIQMLRQLARYIESIRFSLQYHQYPLSQLLREEDNILTGDLLLFIRQLASELESQVAPNVACCLAASMGKYEHLAADVKGVLMELGNSFGRLDMPSQLKSLDGTAAYCKKALATMEDNFQGYTRCCHAYSLCIGVILALFLI